MAKTRNRLMMKQLGELSLVDNPANQHASAVIAKRMAPEPKKLTERLAAFGKRLLDAAIPPADIQAELAAIGKDAETYEDALNRPKVWEKFSAVQDAVQNVMNDDDLSVDDKRSKIDSALSSFRDDILSITKATATESDATCPTCGSTMKDGACPQGHGVKKTDVPNAGGSGDSNTDPIPGAEMRTPQTFQDVAKANEHIGVLTKALNEVEEKLDSEVAKADPISVITKGMTPAAATAYRAMAERTAKAETERLNDGYVAKSAKILKGVLSDDEEGKKAGLAVVKTLAGTATDEERALAEQFVTKIAAQYVEVAKELDGLEVGGAGNGTGSGDSKDRIEKAARELMKADSKLTLPMAVAKALQADHTLYDEEATEPAE